MRLDKLNWATSQTVNYRVAPFQKATPNLGLGEQVCQQRLQTSLQGWIKQHVYTHIYTQAGNHASCTVLEHKHANSPDLNKLLQQRTEAKENRSDSLFHFFRSDLEPTVLNQFHQLLLPSKINYRILDKLSVKIVWFLSAR